MDHGAGNYALLHALVLGGVILALIVVGLVRLVKSRVGRRRTRRGPEGDRGPEA